MNAQPIPPQRIQHLNRAAVRTGQYVLYWMQQSQRAEDNHALEYAISEANRRGTGVLVVFGLTDGYPEANLRHYTFMLEGLRETRAALARRGIKMVVRHGAPDAVAATLGQQASLIVCDRGYLRHQSVWRARVARSAACRVVQVESDAVVPVEVVSDKAEYAARTIRPKLHRHLPDYLVPVPENAVKKPSLALEIDGLDLTDTGAVLKPLAIDRSVRPVPRFFRGGTTRGKALFKDFIDHRFQQYVDNRNQPQTDDISRMSPYLHFGQVSPLYLALAVKTVGNRLAAAREAYLEELIVRRELAINFVTFTLRYDAFACLPGWARTTLLAHRKDPRPKVYTRRQMEAADSHDPYWNAAMQEMKKTGFMHNYMRMYWGKKILEWSNTPEYAFKTALYLNNKYFLDGRDPNSFAGVAWVFGVHDRAWFERPIFGKIRYMAASGLERKSDIQGYVQKIKRLPHPE